MDGGVEYGHSRREPGAGAGLAPSGHRTGAVKVTGESARPGALPDLAAFGLARPNAARIYDYLLGGKDNYAADRQAAEQLLRALPDARLAIADRPVRRQGKSAIQSIHCRRRLSPRCLATSSKLASHSL
jgi:hypothetical protein